MHCDFRFKASTWVKWSVARWKEKKIFNALVYPIYAIARFTFTKTACSIDWLWNRSNFWGQCLNCCSAWISSRFWACWKCQACNSLVQSSSFWEVRSIGLERLVGGEKSTVGTSFMCSSDVRYEFMSEPHKLDSWQASCMSHKTAQALRGQTGTAPSAVHLMPKISQSSYIRYVPYITSAATTSLVSAEEKSWPAIEPIRDCVLLDRTVSRDVLSLQSWLSPILLLEHLEVPAK